jgi:quinol monooxygenase YgiN
VWRGFEQYGGAGGGDCGACCAARAELEQLLAGGLPIVEDEPDTRYWFALKLAPSTFGIFDAFPDDPARQAHLAGKLAQALLAKAPEVLAKDPEIIPVDVLARKDAKREAVHVGLLVRMEAKPEHAADVAGMLEQGAGIVAKEPGTSVWFGVRLSPTTFAIFDAFADDTARKAHLGGELAKALIANADTLLATPFSLENADVLAAKIPR